MKQKKEKKISEKQIIERYENLTKIIKESIIEKNNLKDKYKKIINKRDKKLQKKNEKYFHNFMMISSPFENFNIRYFENQYIIIEERSRFINLTDKFIEEICNNYKLAFKQEICNFQFSKKIGDIHCLKIFINPEDLYDEEELNYKKYKNKKIFKKIKPTSIKVGIKAYKTGIKTLNRLRERN